MLNFVTSVLDQNTQIVYQEHYQSSPPYFIAYMNMLFFNPFSLYFVMSIKHICNE